MADRLDGSLPLLLSGQQRKLDGESACDARIGVEGRGCRRSAARWGRIARLLRLLGSSGAALPRSAESLQQTLRSQGYNAYIRTADGMNRVFVGPLVERSEANRLRDVLQRQQKLDGFVVRFKPEEG